MIISPAIEEKLRALLRGRPAPSWQFRSLDAARPPGSAFFIQGPCSRMCIALIMFVTFPLPSASYLCVSVCVFLARGASPSLTASHCPHLPNQLAGENVRGGDPTRMLDEVRRIHGGNLENAVFSVPNTRGRHCLPCLMNFDKSHKHGTVTRIAMSCQAETLRVQSSAQSVYLKANPGKRPSRDSPFATKGCSVYQQDVVRGDVVCEKPEDESSLGSYYQFWSLAHFSSRRRGRTCGLCRLRHFARLLPRIVVSPVAEEGEVPDEDVGASVKDASPVAEAVKVPGEEADASEKDSSSGEDEGTNQEEDNAVLSPPSVDRITQALESTCGDGDGVTKEVSNVLDRREAVQAVPCGFLA